jgi:hypothetical protein
MSYEPEFMRQPQAFAAACDAVRSVDDWIALCRDWFDTARWPRKSPENIALNCARKRGSMVIDGRTWAYTSSVFDLSPAARYEYTKAFSLIGDPLRFPAPAIEQRSAGDGWALECPYCELVTVELNIKAPKKSMCPNCRRRLWTRSGD